jgi:ribosome-associated toxin RatA of RatAB toxin-antitoxin module
MIMADVFKTVLIQHPAERMYHLVTDVAKYPEFLPWCGGTEIYEQTDEILDAKIHIKFKGLKQFFHTRNTNTKPTSIDMVFVDGPFKKFHGHWKFIPLREDACKVEFSLHYEFESIILEKVIGPVFGMIAGTFVDGFVKRADQIYGQ